MPLPGCASPAAAASPPVVLLAEPEPAFPNSADDALKILGSAANRELARQGKVVFVIDEP